MLYEEDCNLGKKARDLVMAIISEAFSTTNVNINSGVPFSSSNGSVLVEGNEFIILL
jgi:hypothetical protein